MRQGRKKGIYNINTIEQGNGNIEYERDRARKRQHRICRR